MSKVEFELILEDGTRKRVTDGILIAAEGKHTAVHCGTASVQNIAIAGMALARILNFCGVPWTEKIRHLWHVAKALWKKDPETSIEGGKSGSH